MNFLFLAAPVFLANRPALSFPASALSNGDVACFGTAELAESRTLVASKVPKDTASVVGNVQMEERDQPDCRSPESPECGGHPFPPGSLQD